MPVVFNPFTGNLDFTDTTAAGGANTQVQFNDGGTLAGDTAFTWDKTNDQLTISGDVNLDTGGGFSTTIQSVTPTANRTISFPDQTGTVGLVAGATGNIQYNSAGALAGSTKLNTELDWTSAAGTYIGLKVNVDNGAGGAPLGSGNLLDLQSNGTSVFTVSTTGTLDLNNSGTVSVNGAPVVFYEGVTGTRIRGRIGSIPLNPAANQGGFYVASSADGLATFQNGAGSTGYFRQVPVAIANLPAAATVGSGTRGFVNDASVSTFYSVVAVNQNDGGSTIVPVFSDGTNWRIG